MHSNAEAMLQFVELNEPRRVIYWAESTGKDRLILYEALGKRGDYVPVIIWTVLVAGVSKYQAQ